MATSKNTLAKRQTFTPSDAKAVAEMLAPIMSQSEAKASDIAIPDFLQAEGTFTREAQDGFAPVMVFNEPGQYRLGRYIMTREGVGPNASNMYSIKCRVLHEDGKQYKDMVVAVWGSTILDKKFAELDPHPMDPILIQYLGTVETKRNQQPAKDFRLRVCKEEAVKGMVPPRG